MINFLDTSAILNGALEEFENIYISSTALNELENIKTNSNKDLSIKYLARKAVRDIIFNKNITTYVPNEKQVEKYIKKSNLLKEIPDHHLLVESILCEKEEGEKTNFITSDGALYTIAKLFSNIQSSYYIPKENTEEKYCGWKKITPTDLELISLYSHPEINIFNAATNEFCEIFENNELKDIQFWNGDRYTNLKYQTFKNNFGEKISPRNLEQKMLFHLLQDEQIKIKLCLGGFGDGKTWTMLQHALKGIKDGRFSKIVFVRNNIITKGSRDIGFLGGNLVEKIKPYLMPIADLTTPEYLDELIETGTLEPVPLAFMRGRDFSNDTLVFCDEAENLTKENVQLLIGRIGEGSELWFAGDLKQIDSKNFEENNGINKMVERLKNNKLFGMVKLVKSERSKTAELSNLLD